jgi:hypothetical protein
MIPQLVVGLNPQFPPVQDQSVAVIRVEQSDLPIGFPAQRPGAALFRPENQADRREQALNNAMQVQIYDQMFMLGTLFQAATDARALLLSENKTLRQHILQRTITLEKEWLGVAEIFSARVDNLHRGLGNFYQQFLAECQETHKTWDSYQSCEIPGGPGRTWDWNMPNNWNWDKLNQLFQGDYSKLGASMQMRFLHSKYWCHVREPLSATRGLYLTGRDSLKALVRAEIQKIQMESLLEERASDLSRDLQQVPLSNLVDERAVFQVYTQMRKEEIKMMERRNLPLRNENVCLEKKKNELENMEERFLAVFHKHLSPCFQLLAGIKEMEDACGMIISSSCSFKRMNVFNPSLRAGCEAKAIEQKAKFKQHLKEIEPLVEALEKKESP